MKSDRGKALLSREDVRVFFTESGSSDAEGNGWSSESRAMLVSAMPSRDRRTRRESSFYAKYLETLYWSHPATFVKEKVNRRLSCRRRKERQ